MFRYVLLWIPMLLIAIANGAFRQLVLANAMAEPLAHLLSTLTGSVAMGVLIWFVVRLWPPPSGRRALLIGLVWVVLTVTFECFMGLVLQHRPWAEVLHEYDLSAGRVWVLFLLWLGLAPWVFHRLQASKGSPAR